MKRGPAPARGFEIAIPVAHMRGSVMLFRQSPWYASDFTITGYGHFAVVRLRMAQRIRATIEEISKRFFEDITCLSTIPGGGPLVRELWLYSRHGMLRFFRLEEAGLIEIDCYGFSFVNGRPVIPLTKPALPGTVNPVPTGPAAGGVAGSIVHPPTVPGDLARAKSPAAGPRGPIVRWLVKMNAGHNPVFDGTAPSGPAGSVKNTGASGPPTQGVGAINADQPVVSGSDTYPVDTDSVREPGKYGGVK